MERANHTAVKGHRRTPQGEARAEAQRQRILSAAQTCFVAQGFHATSVATICGTAQMSAGLIYRYFDSKDEIILAIIERQLQEARVSIAAFKASSDLVDRVSDILARWRSNDLGVFNPVLFLEISAQASRDPKIAKALADSDRILSTDQCEWLRLAAHNQGQDLDDEEEQMRLIALQCFVEGVFVRAVRQPDLDPRILAESLAQFLRRLPMPPPALPA